MNKRFLNRKTAAIAAVAGITLGIAGAAFAYFTTSGSGTGSAQAGTSTGLEISATITPGVGGIVPGGKPADVAFSITNPGTGNQELGTISLVSVEAYSDAAHTTDITGTGIGQCDTSYFSMVAVPENQNIAGGGTVTGTTDGSLVYADSLLNQDGCKNAYLVATFSS